VQRELREVKGVSVLLYDQTCAAEKRRRRKRGTFPDPDKRVIINELVCEGCGDCGVQSNCVSSSRRDRVRPQAAHRPVELQQGFFLRQGLLPVLRHRPRREAAQAGGPAGKRRSARGRARAAPFALDRDGWSRS
jgi:indolepyruvate ferredoxin oxidoreductase